MQTMDEADVVPGARVVQQGHDRAFTVMTVTEGTVGYMPEGVDLVAPLTMPMALFVTAFVPAEGGEA